MSNDLRARNLLDEVLIELRAIGRTQFDATSALARAQAATEQAMASLELPDVTVVDTPGGEPLQTPPTEYVPRQPTEAEIAKATKWWVGIGPDGFFVECADAETASEMAVGVTPDPTIGGTPPASGDLTGKLYPPIEPKIEPDCARLSQPADTTNHCRECERLAARVEELERKLAAPGVLALESENTRLMGQVERAVGLIGRWAEIDGERRWSSELPSEDKTVSLDDDTIAFLKEVGE